MECLANRCVPSGGEPVPANTRRRVYEPKALAVLHASAEAEPGLPPAIVLGSQAQGPSAVYLSFGTLPFAPDTIDSAFLVLQPIQAGPRLRPSASWLTRQGEHAF